MLCSALAHRASAAFRRSPWALIVVGLVALLVPRFVISLGRCKNLRRERKTERFDRFHDSILVSRWLYKVFLWLSR